ncbi:RadC family protein [Paraburkholderia ferrariae]|uniref:RadC family protein n=1 Tax=Paraburkholderia ferrariae TaxID=386056 RepID=UPI000A06B727|nr:DNA repair protein RadC [Paraburkholderia ferrariae]
MPEAACAEPVRDSADGGKEAAASTSSANDGERSRAARLALPAADAAVPARAQDMPRERLRTAGPGALSDVELLALLLGSGLPGHGVFEVARSLIERFGTLRAMLDAQPEELGRLRGIGPAKAAKLQAVLELARRALVEELDSRPVIDTPGAVEDYLRLLIGGRPYEVFVCLYLDVRHRLIRPPEESSRGSLSRLVVYPREIVRRTLTLNAASLIVAHNHPSGAVQPSAADRRLTRVLRDTLALVEVQLIDHLVIGARETYSFARNDWN